MGEESETVLKKFIKTDQELIHDIIDMKLLDVNKPIYIRGDDHDEESDVI